MNLRFSSLLIAVIGSLFTTSFGQDAPGNPEDRVLTTVGTSIAAASGMTPVYLLWTSETPHLLDGHGFAVFRKEGGVNSVANYALAGLVQRQTNAAALRMLLDKALGLGADFDGLEMGLDALFGEVASLQPYNDSFPNREDRLVAKLRYLLTQSGKNERTYRDLQLLSRMHPWVSLCLGQAFVTDEKAQSTFTYEIRLCPVGTDDPATQCQQVVGRVSVVAGAPVLLSEPDPAQQLPVADAKGHLNVRLRWGIPNELRRRIVLHYGYNVYRVEKAFAEDGARKWQANTPQPSDASYWRDHVQAHPEVVRVNGTPILPEALLTHEEAGDPKVDTYFITDDNDRFDEGGAPFGDKDQFYYFVTARDILGRDGFSAPGTLVRLCDQMPPPAPMGVQAESRYDPVAGRQVIALTFAQNDNSGEEQTRRYHLYRWESRQAISNNDDSITPIASLDHVDDQARLDFVDRWQGSPVEAGVVYWYTIRAEDSADCGPNGEGNLSGHSGPVSGVVRDRSTPPAAPGSLNVNCSQPVASRDGDVETLAGSIAQVEKGTMKVRLECRKVDPNETFEWVEFWYGKDSPTDFIVRSGFGASSARVDAIIPGLNQKVFAKVKAHGVMSPFSEGQMVEEQTDGLRQRVPFKADLEFAYRAFGDGCDLHFPRPDDKGIDITVGASERAVSFRIYMRLDNGPLQLVAQGSHGGQETDVRIDEIPSYAESLCFYLQVIDANGNPSPLTELGCTGVSSAVVMATPMLSAPEAKPGNVAALEWFCPSPGIDRFHVYVGVAGNAQSLPAVISGHLSASEVDLVPGPSDQFTESFRAYTTGRIDGSFPSVGDEIFQANVSVIPQVTYIFMVQPIGPNGELGAISNPQTFQWRSPEAVYEACAAPLAWPHDQVQSSFDAWEAQLMENPVEVNMTLLQSDAPGLWGGVGVKIGRCDWARLSKVDPLSITQYPEPITPLTSDKASNAYVLPGATPLEEYLFEPDLFPCVLYRVRVPDDKVVSAGELYQVSPLMESIVHETRLDDDEVFDGAKLVIFDPHLYLQKEGEGANFHVDLYLRDTQPVVRDTTYQYLLVQLDERKEIRRVRSLGTLTTE